MANSSEHKEETIFSLAREFFSEFHSGRFEAAVSVGENLELFIEEFELHNKNEFHDLSGLVAEICYPFYIAYMGSLFICAVNDRLSGEVQLENVNSLKYLLKRINMTVTRVSDRDLTLSQQTALYLLSDNLFGDLKKCAKSFWSTDYGVVVDLLSQLAPKAAASLGKDSAVSPRHHIGSTLMLMLEAVQRYQYGSVGRSVLALPLTELIDAVQRAEDLVLSDCSKYGWNVSENSETGVRIVSPVPIPVGQLVMGSTSNGLPGISCKQMISDLAEYIAFFERKSVSCDTKINYGSESSSVNPAEQYHK